MVQLHFENSLLDCTHNYFTLVSLFSCATFLALFALRATVHAIRHTVRCNTIQTSLFFIAEYRIEKQFKGTWGLNYGCLKKNACLFQYKNMTEYQGN